LAGSGIMNGAYLPKGTPSDNGPSLHATSRWGRFNTDLQAQAVGRFAYAFASAV